MRRCLLLLPALALCACGVDRGARDPTDASMSTWLDGVAGSADLDGVTPLCAAAAINKS